MIDPKYDDLIDFITEGAFMVFKDQTDEPIEDRMTVEDIAWNILEDRRECDDEENIEFYGPILIEFIKVFETEENETLEQYIKDHI